MYTRIAFAALLASAAVLVPVFSAHAEEKGARLEAAFKKADQDNDGTLTKDEAKSMPRVAKNFDAIDTGKDGTVSLDEIHASMKQMGKEMHDRGMEKFKSADKDSSGTLTRDEAKLMPRVAENFDAIDTGKDGTVSMDEIRASMKHMGKEMHDSGMERFKSADKDANGTLTRDEAKSMPRVAKNFDAIDTGKDGSVSEKEIHDFMKPRHDKHHSQ